MRVDELIVKLENFNETLPEVRDKLILDAVYSAAALAKQRVINDRTAQDGTIFGIYSEKYLNLRKRKGKGSDPKINFSFSGQMWRSTQPYVKSTSDTEVRIRVGPLPGSHRIEVDDQIIISGVKIKSSDLRDTPPPTNEELMQFHDKRFGEIMALSQDEINGIISDFTEGIQDHINKTIY